MPKGPIPGAPEWYEERKKFLEKALPEVLIEYRRAKENYNTLMRQLADTYEGLKRIEDNNVHK